LSSDLKKKIDLTIRRFELREVPTDYKSAVAVTSPTRDTLELLQIAQGDFAARGLDMETFQALNEMEGMPNLLHCKNLAENLVAAPILPDRHLPLKSLDEIHN